jgi:hypothetical protein
MIHFLQVYDATKGSDAGQYGFEIHLKNNEDQDYCPETWSLFVSVTTDFMCVNQISKLEQRVRKDVSLKTFFVVRIAESFSPVRVSCNLVANISEESETKPTLWAVIPIAETTLDASYFFSPVSQCTKNSISGDLLKIAHSHIGENSKSLESQQVPVTGQHMYEFRMLRDWENPSDIWAAVMKNCRHLVSEVNHHHRYHHHHHHHHFQ